MLYFCTVTLPAWLTSVTANWQMSFQSVHFLLFLPLVVGAYYLLPKKFRLAWILLSNLYFYFFAAPLYLPVLFIATLATYCMAHIISVAKSPRARMIIAVAFVAICILALCFFKYNFALYSGWLTPLLSSIGLKYNAATFSTVAAVGISFYTFTAIGYLIDVARKDVEAEKNFIAYAAFFTFFPSIISGPISRAKDLLPKLKDSTRRFDAQNASSALRRMAIGFFKKMAVADTLRFMPNAVFASPEVLATHGGPTIILASILFMFQLYFDFSGYSDIAIGTAQLLGINLPENFNTPYFSTNFSGFWARWHMSLSAWLQDYIFTPLVWSRWTEKIPFIGKKISKPPILSSILMVFFISGLWHGDTMSFVVWGMLQGAFRVGEELLHRTLGKPKKNLPKVARFGKTALVLILWCQSLLFFRVGLMPKGSVALAFSTFVRQFTSFSFSTAGKVFFSAYNAEFLSIDKLALVVIAFSCICLAVALYADWIQYAKLDGKPLSTSLTKLKKPLRWIIYYALMLACFAAFVLQNGGFGSAGFIYANF